MTFDAKWYSLLHTGNESDVSFYLSAVAGAKTVLELGCGSGRITFPIAQSGVFITGVDNAPDMLSLLQAEKEGLSDDAKERIETLLADMRTLSLNRRFDKVIIPYNGLLCMLTEADVRLALETAAGHLTPHGELIFDIYDVPSDALDDEDDEEEDEATDDGYTYILSIETDKDPVHVFERSVPHADPRRFDAAYRYQREPNPQDVRVVTEYTIPQRCILKEEIPELLWTAGLQLTSMTGDFKDHPVDEDTLQLVIRARLSAVG